MLRLNVICMSERAGSRSTFDSLFASDCLYQCPATGAPGKSRNELSDEVLPSVALVAVQVCAANEALIVIVTLSGRMLPQMLAA